MQRLLGFVLVLTFTLLVGVPAAQADSIVFIKRGDVWLAKGDGSGQRALTRNGTASRPYRSPAMSDAGVITAVRGRRDVHFFNRRGRRLRRARDISGGPTPPFDAVIVDHAISPNGKLLASTLWITSREQAPASEPQGTDYNTSVWYTRVSDGKILGTTDDGQNATWVRNDLPVVWAPNVFHSADAWVVNLSDPNQPTQWFQDRETVNVLDPSDGEPLNDGELTRAQDKLAVVRGPSTTASATPTMLRVYAASGVTSRPTERCDLRSAPNTRIESPTWSPDGAQLAWGERGGIWSSPISGGTAACNEAPRQLIAGGSEPDWGRASVPPRR